MDIQATPLDDTLLQGAQATAELGLMIPARLSGAA
jgi:hypothetical protein